MYGFSPCFCLRLGGSTRFPLLAAAQKRHPVQPGRRATGWRCCPGNEDAEPCQPLWLKQRAETESFPQARSLNPPNDQRRRERGAETPGCLPKVTQLIMETRP